MKIVHGSPCCSSFAICLTQLSSISLERFTQLLPSFRNVQRICCCKTQTCSFFGVACHQGEVDWRRRLGGGGGGPDTDTRAARFPHYRITTKSAKHITQRKDPLMVSLCGREQLLIMPGMPHAVQWIVSGHDLTWFQPWHATDSILIAHTYMYKFLTRRSVQ